MHTFGKQQIKEKIEKVCFQLGGWVSQLLFVMASSVYHDSSKRRYILIGEAITYLTDMYDKVPKHMII